MTAPRTLSEIFDLEPIEENLFRGRSPQDAFRRIFGGQVVAQALLAAYRTVEGRVCHSLHAYFVRPGDPAAPVLYQVDRARDGGSFTTRRVTGIQHGEHIFNLAASFQTPESGFEHQSPMPEAPAPDELPTEADRLEALGDRAPPAMRAFYTRRFAIDMRFVDPLPIETDAPLGPHKRVWMRARDPVRDDIAHQQAALAYASDMTFIETALRAHGLGVWTPGLQVASLDHAIWFHRPSDFNAWHLFAQDSPSASGGRGLVRGAMFTEDGRMVASMAQEGLMRLREP